MYKGQKGACAIKLDLEKAFDKLECLLNISEAKDLGKYLGFPTSNGRVTRRHFQFIIDKVKNKLASRETNMISFAGRKTIVQQVVSIPAYSTNVQLFLSLFVMN
ncbi:hypothetical protein ACH5RR_025541 [Cinchona calisaya]|uniref:Reverse transcriptase n=1 Tax=Cinchona calisaya TaxID=153742 RepID=A0ABD2Z124_9GENT